MEATLSVILVVEIAIVEETIAESII